MASCTDTAAITALVEATAGMMFLITPSVSLFGNKIDEWEIMVPWSQTPPNTRQDRPTSNTHPSVPVGDPLDLEPLRAGRGLLEDPLHMLRVVGVQRRVRVRLGPGHELREGDAVLGLEAWGQASGRGKVGV